jgi:hypothetical protein
MLIWLQTLIFSNTNISIHQNNKKTHHVKWFKRNSSKGVEPQSILKYSMIKVEENLHTMLVNNVKHVSTKGLFLKYSWHLRFFSWHIVKTLTNVQLFWMIKCIKRWMIKCTKVWMKYVLVCNYLFQLG